MSCSMLRLDSATAATGRASSRVAVGMPMAGWSPRSAFRGQIALPARSRSRHARHADTIPELAEPLLLRVLPVAHHVEDLPGGGLLDPERHDPEALCHLVLLEQEAPQHVPRIVLERQRERSVR